MRYLPVVVLVTDTIPVEFDVIVHGLDVQGPATITNSMCSCPDALARPRTFPVELGLTYNPAPPSKLTEPPVEISTDDRFFCGAVQVLVAPKTLNELIDVPDCHCANAPTTGVPALDTFPDPPPLLAPVDSETQEPPSKH